MPLHLCFAYRFYYSWIILIVALTGMGLVAVNALAELLGHFHHRHDHSNCCADGFLDVPFS